MRVRLSAWRFWMLMRLRRSSFWTTSLIGRCQKSPKQKLFFFAEYMVLPFPLMMPPMSIIYVCSFMYGSGTLLSPLPMSSPPMSTTRSLHTSLTSIVLRYNHSFQCSDVYIGDHDAYSLAFLQRRS